MKCKSCGQEGFKNPREIVVHKKNCSTIIQDKMIAEGFQKATELTFPVTEETVPVFDNRKKIEVPQVLAQSVQELQPQQTINPEIEIKIEEQWQKRMEEPVHYQEAQISQIKQEPEILSADPIPPMDVSTNENKEILMKIFNDLRTPEGKSVISIMLVQQKVEDMQPEEIFNYLFTRIPDGDERAILRKFFTNVSA